MSIVKVKSGDVINESGYYKYAGHSNGSQSTIECKPLPAETKRYFLKGITAHNLVACGHSVDWVKT